MKKLLLLLLLPVGIAGAQETVATRSRIQQVHVFRSQAQIIRHVNASIPQGVSSLIIDPVSPRLIEGSIEVSVPEGVELLSVNLRNEFLKPQDKPAAIVVLEDSLEAVKDRLAEVSADREALQWQKEVLAVNKAIGGANQGVKADELEDILLIYEKKLHEIFNAQLLLNRKEKTLKDLKAALEQQLQEQRENLGEGRRQLVVVVRNGKRADDAAFTVRYLVDGVSWQPFYDIHLRQPNTPVEFMLKASIQQQTGENWNDVKLHLSTTDPYQGGAKPELQPLWLNYRQPVMAYRGARANMKRMEAEPAAAYADGVAAGIATPQQNLLNLSFEVNGKVNVPSGEKVHQFSLYNFTSPASTGYACVPKVDPSVYVTANIAVNEMISQLNGEANIYYAGTFSGKTFLSNPPGDSLLLTLGKEHRIQVKREMVRTLSGKSFLGSNKKDAQTWEITLTNTSSEAFEMKLEDQVPVSANTEIEVKLTDAGGAKHNPENGHLEWNLKLQPKQTVKVRFALEVVYPANKQLNDY